MCRNSSNIHPKCAVELGEDRTKKRVSMICVKFFLPYEEQYFGYDCVGRRCIVKVAGTAHYTGNLQMELDLQCSETMLERNGYNELDA